MFRLSCHSLHVWTDPNQLSCPVVLVAALSGAPVLAELPSLQGVYGFKVDANLELTDSNIEYYSLIEP